MEEETGRCERIKDHLIMYKEAYIVGAIGLAGITCLIMRDRHAVLQTGADGPDVATMRSLNFNFFSRQTGSANISTVISRDGRGHPGYITRWLEGEIDYDTQGLAAQEHRIKPSVMSLHIQGRIPDINGQHFERVGVPA
jgi:hypothetical protein